MYINEEIEDLSDLGQCVAWILSKDEKSSDELWDFFEEVLSDDSWEGLKDVVKHYEGEIRGAIFEKE